MIVAAIMMAGFPATGKTFVAKKLINSFKETHQTFHTSSLDFREKFDLFALESNEQRNKVYDLLAGHVDQSIKQGSHEILIIDGNFNKRERRQKLYSVLKGCPIYIVKCTVSSEMIIEKIMEKRRENQHLPENRAATMALYNLIKNNGDDIEKDELVKNGVINLIQFNSEDNVIEKLNLSKENDVGHITAKISSIIEGM